MKLLLDTHTLLWTLLERKRLSRAATDAIENEASEVFVSVVSAWEIEIKRAKGKLKLPSDLGSALSQQRFGTLPVSLRHALAVESLPHHHRDPFDRMLVAQAQVEGLTIVTSDRQMRRYPIAVLPAT